MTTTIRPPLPADEARWRELFRAYGEFYETQFGDDVLDRVWALLTTEGSGIDALLAERDGEVVGFAHFRSFPDTFTGGRDWFLDDLFVDPEVRGTGAGRALIEAIVERAHTSGAPATLRWITAESNTTAQALYDRIATRTSWVTYEKRF
ncbi:GNAT family N-acetyltransferase [Salinibacterium sp. ZJ70]|uniref:GNAT family N-acetyltransferase n=1 Tax=Salinibacterium sp. ZJ70 TaxID=2708084 RepID=UPI0014226B46|nr:GNAT family N-acetyltransferase [Salinibacterium sp. ZJ70]